MKFVAILFLIAFVALTVAQLTTPQIIGEWEGESKCVNRIAAPACKDEHVIFHITQVLDSKNKPVNNSVLVRADKVVDKKRLVMGYLTFTVDPAAFTLQNVFKRKSTSGTWKMTVKGNQMTGTLTKLPESVVVRLITLNRKKK